MKNMKLIPIMMLLAFTSCKKEDVSPEPQLKSSQDVVIDTTASGGDTLVIDTVTTPNPTPNPDPIEILFESNLDDSLYLESNELIDDVFFITQSNGFHVRIETVNPDSVEVGFYTNEYLIRNTGFGINLTHGVYLADGSLAHIQIGSTSTQINTLEVTRIENDLVWFTYDVEWTYTHWLYTEKNKSGTIVGEVNGYKFK